MIMVTGIFMTKLISIAFQLSLLNAFLFVALSSTSQKTNVLNQSSDISSLIFDSSHIYSQINCKIFISTSVILFAVYKYILFSLK